MEMMFFLCKFLAAASLLHSCFKNTTVDSGREPTESKHVEPFRRKKREWVIPDINVPENDSGPFPKFMTKIKSSSEEKVAITYQLVGPGADKAPEGVFTMDRRSGALYVTRPLDREKISRYVLLAHATVKGSKAEEPMKLVINVVDQNDNVPECTRTPFYGNVSESAQVGESFMSITAEDKDAPNTDNADIRYRLKTQKTHGPKDKMFSINPVSGLISTMAVGLDREMQSKYELIIEAADMAGEGLRTTCTAIVSITDSNDHAPRFTFTSVSASTPENEVGREVLRLTVTDEDDLGTPNTNTKYTIVSGNQGGHFSVKTGPWKMEGMLTTAKAVDFERDPMFTLLLVATNDAPFSKSVSTSTCTITVTVLDQNEPPFFKPPLIHRIISEEPPLGSQVADLRAKDPDTSRHQHVRYALHSDPARWLAIDKNTGSITVKGNMDRESPYIKDNKYTVLVLAYDNGKWLATSPGWTPPRPKSAGLNSSTPATLGIVMSENMFQEGLYQVYFKERPQTRTAEQEDLHHARIHRWFSSVVNTRLLVSGVVQFLSGAVCVLTTVCHSCVSYDCSVAMTMPVWSSLLFMAAGCVAIEVQRKANKLKIIILMGVHLLSLLVGFSLLLAYCLSSQQSHALNTRKQLVGSYVAKGSAVAFTLLCLLLSLYIVLLSWRGLRRYGSATVHVRGYDRVMQEPDDDRGPLMERVDSV
ncbi:cadherin-1-like isoform X3 [Vanacampus margaritifer]